MPLLVGMGAYNTVHVSNLSELDAVNLMMSNAGESPVSTLEDLRNADAIQARQILLDASRSIQLEGWHFNTEHNVKLEVTKPTPGIIPVPNNSLRVDVSPFHAHDFLRRDIIQRGDRLYDMDNHTDLFTEDIIVSIVYLLPFEEMPEAARHYIAINAARRFRQAITGGDDGMGSLSQNDELRARNTLMREDLIGQDRGFLTYGRHTFMGHDIQRVLRRRL